jgi:hypothetical protein
MQDEDWSLPGVRWPAEKDEGRQVEALIHGRIITGSLAMIGFMDDDGECDRPTMMPDWVIASDGQDHTFHDVDLWRYSPPS